MVSATLCGFYNQRGRKQNSIQCSCTSHLSEFVFYCAGCEMPLFFSGERRSLLRGFNSCATFFSILFRSGKPSLVSHLEKSTLHTQTTSSPLKEIPQRVHVAHPLKIQRGDVKGKRLGAILRSLS